MNKISTDQTVVEKIMYNKLFKAVAFIESFELYN